MDKGQKIDLEAFKDKFARGEKVSPLIFYQDDKPAFVLMPFETFQKWFDSENFGLGDDLP
jgi:hypothetical protein